MIPLNVLTQQSLFVLLHQIDYDLAEQVKNRACPIVADHCTMPTTCVSPGVVLLTLKKYFKFVSVCAAAVKDAVVELYHHLSGFGERKYIGPR